MRKRCSKDASEHLARALDTNVRYYYKYYKNRKSKAKYLRVIVKYLNGEGFIITAYFVIGIT
jgi:hypothetical protein